MTIALTIEHRLRSFDGSSTEPLAEVAREFGQQESYLAALIECVTNRSRDVQAGAAWLIKHHVDAGHIPTPDLTETLAASALAFCSWEAQLSVLQIVDRLPLTDVAANDLSALAAACMHARRAVLRAWAFDALLALAKFDERFADAAALAAKSAQEDEAASVRARARLRGAVPRAPYRPDIQPRA